MPRTTRTDINRANARKQSEGFWTEERVATLRKLWAENVLAEKIAAAIGHGCTRGAVIGKANRLGLASRTGWNGRRETQVIRVSHGTGEARA